MMFHITAPHFCAGGVYIDDRAGLYVFRAAPIIIYMEIDRWDANRVEWYCRKKGWKYETTVTSASCEDNCSNTSPTEGACPHKDFGGGK